MATRRSEAAALVAILVVAMLVHGIALHGPFQFDDWAGVAVDPGAHRLEAWWADAARHVRPLTKLSFVLTHALGEAIGDVPAGHRLGNIAIHLATVATLWALGRRLALDCVPGTAAIAASKAALAAAAVIAVHPLATEAVSYLSGRSMALGTLMAAGSLLAYAHGRRRGQPAWVVAAAVAGLAAGLAREAAFVVPMLWIAWELARADRSTAPWSAARLRPLRGGIAAGIAIAVAVACWMVLHARYGPLLEVSARIASRRAGEPSLAVALEYFGGAVLMLRYPTIDPDLSPATMGIAHRSAIGIAAGGALLLAWRARLRAPHWLLAAVWIGAWIVPLYALSLRNDALAERHFYPAIWGAAFALSVAVVRAADTPAMQRAAGAFAAVVLLALAAVAATRIADYRSEVALWEAARRSAPHKVRVLNNLGVAYIEAGRWDEAREVLERAAMLDPTDAQVADNLLSAVHRDTGPVRWPAGRD